jgi:hypothetical protein
MTQVWGDYPIYYKQPIRVCIDELRLFYLKTSIPLDALSIPTPTRDVRANP